MLARRKRITRTVASDASAFPALRAIRLWRLARPLRQMCASARRRPFAAAIVMLMCVPALSWLGCSVEKHYNVLSFFFDGVPDPRVVSASADAVFIAKQTGGVYYVHEPYAREGCAECHGDSPGGIMVSTVDPAVCLKCHASVTDAHRVMHGPVAANACLWCHAPHESTIKPLLRTTAPQLCSQCHGPNMMGDPTSPVHADLSRDCLECHKGHGGADRFFLTSAPGAGVGAAQPPQVPDGSP